MKSCIGPIELAVGEKVNTTTMMMVIYIKQPK